MRKFRGWSLFFSTAILSTLSAATLRAQSNQLTLTDRDSPTPISAGAPASGVTPTSQAPILTAFGKSPMVAVPVSQSAGALGQGQTPRAMAPSQLNPSSIFGSASQIAPASYTEMPYGQPSMAPPGYAPSFGPGMGPGPGGIPMQGGMGGPPNFGFGGAPMPGGFGGPPGMDPSSYAMQASYGGSDPGMMMGEPTEMSGEYSGGMDGEVCPMCGGQGCDNCSLGDGVLGGFLQRLLPYAEGGRCAPRWYDIIVDTMYVQRDNAGQNVVFSTLTRLIFGGTPALSTDNLNYDDQLGLRFTAALQILPGHATEFTYYGLFNWAAVASVSDPTNNLFSVYSDYGLNPFNGFDPTDQAQFQSIRSSSTIDSFEINFRKRNTAPNCRLQWSTMWGGRYVYLLDDLEFFSLGRNVGGVPVGQSDTDVRARNSLMGFQVGGDVWSTIVPGISFGTELKGGVYGNYAKQNTSVVSTGNLPVGANPNLLEEATNNDIAFVGEANLMFIYRTSPNWTIRFGYNVVVLDGVAIASDNFNTQNPFAGRPVRELDDNSQVVLHGGFGGFEWTW